jgi:transcription elongation factor Elf1
MVEFAEDAWLKTSSKAHDMDKVVDIREKIDRREQGRQLEKYRDQVRAILKVLQCTSCQFKCAMCGHHLSEAPGETERTSGPLGFVFCDGCREEFEAYLDISSGEKEAEVFWHNEAWLEMWSAWVDYQQAIHRFMHSSEFKLLLSETDG